MKVNLFIEQFKKAYLRIHFLSNADKKKEYISFLTLYLSTYSLSQLRAIYDYNSSINDVVKLVLGSNYMDELNKEILNKTKKHRIERLKQILS